MSANFDFLADGCAAGQTLVRLVSRGNAILAELLRLSQNIPAVFKQQPVNPKDQRGSLAYKYAGILFDFNYLKNTDLYEDRIDSNPTLAELDREFREAHIEILKRFYLLFESIYKYVADFGKYADDLTQGVFIQITVEDVISNVDGKQLMAEALYLFGVMLIIMDELIEGTTREKLLISYLRYKDQSDNPLIELVCQLCSRTGYVPGQQKPTNYPIKLFKRFPLPMELIRMIIGRLRTDDIYGQMRAYPSPDHRSAALASQACMLYIILFFAPDLLEKEFAPMREIVDKHFADNWIISYYLGYTADLSISWAPFPAAVAALNNTIGSNNITVFANRYNQQVIELTPKLDQYLSEGVLTDSLILEKNHVLMRVVRDCNVCIRWLMLHTQTNNKRLRDIILAGFNKNQFLIFILKCAQFEYILKSLYQNLLDTKEGRWNVCKTEATDRMKELSEYFSGEKQLTRVKRNESLRLWFASISEKVANLDFNDSTLAGRKIQQLMQALEEVEQFHQLESNLQARQFLNDTRQYLHQMMNVVNIQEEFMGNLAIVSDMSYGWRLIREFVPRMQDQIKSDPGSVIMLRSTFLKLSSILDLPLVRIIQAKSPDLISVSQYYSSELVRFVRKVLAIVPRSMFIILAEIIDIQTNRFKVLPTKIEKLEVRDLAQLDLRHQLAKATFAISIFTEGMLAMENTLVGIIEVDPKKLLEDGIRKELVKRIASTMNQILVFNPQQGRADELDIRLKDLRTKLDGYRRSFQYIQDYVNIYGLKIWQEEFSRIVNYNVEQECNSFLKKKVYDHQSAFQSQDIPIPIFSRVDESVNFIGRLARELLRKTDYHSTIYLDQMTGWYNEQGKEIVGTTTFTNLTESIGVFGVTGLDRLYSFMIVRELQDVVSEFRMQMKQLTPSFSRLATELHPSSTIPTNAETLYSTVIRAHARVFDSFVSRVSKIGQMQLIRRHIASNLNYYSKIDSKTLFYTLEALNAALLVDIRAHYKNPEVNPYPDSENPLLEELSRYLENVGINDPMMKIYITTKPLNNFPLFMFLFFISQASKFSYNKSLSILSSTTARKKGGIDSTPFIVGYISLLKQFHSMHTQKLLALFGQYIRAYVNMIPKNPKLVDLPKEVQELLLFLETLSKFSPLITHDSLETYLPPFVLDHFTH